MKKTDQEGNPLIGVEFGLFSTKNDKLVVSGTTDDKGILEISDISVGEYFLQVNKARDGYVLNTEKHSVSIKKDASGKPQTLEFTQVNYQGSVELTKTDFESKILPGVEFNLYRADGTLVSSRHTTNEEGLIIVTGLAPGKYHFVETKSAEGNIKNTNPIPFEIVGSALNEPKIAKVNSSNTKASVEFKKTDNQGNPLAGVAFELYTKEKSLITSAEINDKGILRVDNHEPNEYYFIETKAHEGYILNIEKHEFIILDSTTETEVLYELDDFINYQGSVKLQKVDNKGKLLNEARFEIHNKNNDLIGVYTTLDGIIEVNALKPGIYTITEVVSPKGYVLDATPRTIIVPYEHEGDFDTIELNVVNVEEVVISTRLPETGVDKQEHLNKDH